MELPRQLLDRLVDGLMDGLVDGLLMEQNITFEQLLCIVMALPVFCISASSVAMILYPTGFWSSLEYPDILRGAVVGAVIMPEVFSVLFGFVEEQRPPLVVFLVLIVVAFAVAIAATAAATCRYSALHR